ncbi:MAG: hypothetical protein WKG00_03425 [Polyangiaceae bacterium]
MQLSIVALCAGAWLLLSACSSYPDADSEHVGTAQSGLKVFWQNNDDCGDTCPAGQVRTCGDICVTPVPLGNTCTQADCQPTSYCAGWPDSSCLDVGGGQFRCRPAPQGLYLLDGCAAAGESTACPADTICVDHTIMCDYYDANWVSDGYPAKICQIGVKQGGACDSNASSPLCYPCMAGSTCVDGHCRDGCTADTDCPCADDGTTKKNGCKDGACYTCKSLGQTCSSDSTCCDAGTQCKGTCCPVAGSACTSTSQCCKGNVCKQNGTCNVCIADGASCTGNADCCSETCVSGTCRTDCNKKLNDPCPDEAAAAGKKGECKWNAKWTCPNGQYGASVCVAGASSSEAASPKNCDDKDNDCDGDTDEHFASMQACSPGEYDGSCTGFTPGGYYECDGGKKTCVATLKVHYCDSCGANCGTCMNEVCTVSSQCPPGRKCDWEPPNTSGPKTCIDDPAVPDPDCWLPF